MVGLDDSSTNRNVSKRSKLMGLMACGVLAWASTIWRIVKTIDIKRFMLASVIK